MTSHLQEGKELFAYQITTRYLNPWPRYYCFCCWKQTSVIFKFYSRFRFWPLHCHRYVILRRTTKFCTK